MNQTLARELFPEEEILKCVEMSSSAYDGVKAFGDFEILAYSEDNKINRPVWFCLKSGDDIYVVVRGTNSGKDSITDLLFFQVKECISGVDIVFNFGFYESARHIYESIKQHLCDAKGKIIFTGHSLGAAVASNLCIFAKLDPIFSDRYIRGYCFAPPPSSSYNSPEIDRCIASFVNDGDPVPTLSLRNVKYLVTPIKKIFKLYVGTVYETGALEAKIVDLLTPNGTKLNSLFKELHSIMKNKGIDKLKAVFEPEKFRISKPNGSIFLLSGNGSILYKSIFRDHKKLHRLAVTIPNHLIAKYDNTIFCNMFLNP